MLLNFNFNAAGVLHRHGYAGDVNQGNAHGGAALGHAYERGHVCP